MKKLAILAAILAIAGSAFAGDLLGVKIVDTGPTPLEGLSHFTWQNNSGGFLAVKRAQLITSGGNGASWILRRGTGDVVIITTNPDGEAIDFGTDYMMLAPGDYLDVYFHAQYGSVFIWASFL
jgi:hypothetical protein